jgi:hypothetical protein
MTRLSGLDLRLPFSWALPSTANVVAMRSTPERFLFKSVLLEDGHMKLSKII